MRTILLIALMACTPVGAVAATPQEHVHGASHDVMPFDMGKTLHIFAMNDDGGVQKVVVRDRADLDQVELIRRHVQHEAAAFQKGDYDDPAHLHGAAMPGLAELREHASRVRVTYAPLPDGAEITFEARDRHTVTAIHRWFGAQLSEHGADARAE
jgi:hypothetical protein